MTKTHHPAILRGNSAVLLRINFIIHDDDMMSFCDEESIMGDQLILQRS